MLERRQAGLWYIYVPHVVKTAVARSDWLSGSGIKTGQSIGKTDELGFHITVDPIHVQDLQATMLHCLGMDHTRLTYRYRGRDFRLTDVGGNVVQKLLD